MLELLNLGLSEIDIQDMIETNPEIVSATEEEIIKLIQILKKIGCSNKLIKNIIVSNPFYLNRIDTDIINLFQKLYSIGLNNLSTLFDSNPHLLNKAAFEIDDFIKEKLKTHSIEEIIWMIENNPYILEEE